MQPIFTIKGHMGEYLQSEAGEADFKWQREFGHVIRLKGILGVCRSWLSRAQI